MSTRSRLSRISVCSALLLLVALAAVLTPAQARAEDKVVPAAAALLIESLEGTAYCSGSLIAPDVVMTAAHCVTDLRAYPFKTLTPATAAVRVQVGAADGADAVNGVRATSWVAAFQGIGLRKGKLALIGERFDIAYLRLQTPVTGVEPLAIGGLPPIKSVVEQVGYTGAKLRQVRFVRTLANKACLEKRNTGKLTVCAGKPTRHNPPCAGDSGSPLVFQGKVFAVMSGYSLASRQTRRCGALPFVYTRADTAPAKQLLTTLPAAPAG